MRDELIAVIVSMGLFSALNAGTYVETLSDVDSQKMFSEFNKFRASGNKEAKQDSERGCGF